MAVVGALRKYKSDAQLPMNAPLARVEVTAPVGAYRGSCRACGLSCMGVRPSA